MLIQKDSKKLPIIGITQGDINGIGYEIILKTLSSKELNPEFPLYSVYAYGSKNTEKLEEKLVAEGYHISARLQLGSTIGAHIGPGAFGIIYVEK